MEPGEVLVIDPDGARSLFLPDAGRRAFCIFEHIYFARPDSLVFGEKVDKVRRRLGKRLARDAPAEADIVISVPDSGNTAALGYANASGIRYEIGLIRNHYIGRAFIAPHQEQRQSDIRVKLNAVRGVVEGRDIVLVDDSIVRGTTMRQIVRLLKDKGAGAVHVRISSPPIAHPCFYGIDISNYSELIASEYTIDGIRTFIGADTLGYLSLEGMLSCVTNPQDHCQACFSGEYPAAVPEGFEKLSI